MSGMIDEPYEQQIILTRRKLKAPRAAAISGILFAVLYGSAMILLALSIPPFAIADNTWIETSGNTVSLALLLVPYSGIAFLWFIGVIRDHLGDAEDRLFSTVFLGSGLLFMALTFLAAAFVGGLISSYALMSNALIESGVFLYARSVVYQVLNLYAIRMAGVFMISLGTIWLRTGVIAPRLDDPDLRAGAGASAEHQFVPMGDPDLSGMDPDNQRSPAYSEPPRSPRRGAWRVVMREPGVV